MSTESKLGELEVPLLGAVDDSLYDNVHELVGSGEYRRALGTAELED